MVPNGFSGTWTTRQLESSGSTCRRMGPTFLVMLVQKKNSTVTGVTSISVVVARRSIRMICLLSAPFASANSFLPKSSRSALSPAPAPSGPVYSFLQSPVSVSPSRKFLRLAFASLGIFTSSPVKSNTIRVERRATTLSDVTPVTVCQLAHLSAPSHLMLFGIIPAPDEPVSSVLHKFFCFPLQ